MDVRRRPHAVLIPFPAQGHVRPFMQLAHQLCHVHGFHTTFITTSYIHKRLGHHKKMAGTDDGLHFLDMQEGFPEDYYTIQKLNVLYHACSTIAPRLKTLIGELPIPPTCIISDLGILEEAHKVAIQFGVSSAAFSTQNALTLSAKYYCPRLVAEGLLPLPKISDDNIPTPSTLSTKKKHVASKDTDVRTLHTLRVGEEVALLAREVTCVPGMHPIRLREYYTPLLVRDLSDPTFQSLSATQIEHLRKCDWVLMNTFHELEAAVIEALQRDSGIRLTSVGPLVAATIPEGGIRAPREEKDVVKKTVNNTGVPSDQSSMWPEETKKCIEWLDTQSPSSVIYVSFGSLMNITTDKLHEFVLGLEDSGVPFLLVLRPNVVDGGHGQTGVSAPETGSGGQLLHEIVLPLGFEERTKTRSLIVSWAPQLRVLGHPATAGFVSHCGWNSVLESISMGMPMLAYPFFADQPINSRYCVSVWRTALEFETTASDEEGRHYLERHEIAAKVKALVTEGEGVRGGAIAWGEAARKAVAVGGSSYLDMAAFVTDMYRRAHEATP